jgi:hypothetical protein
MLQLINDFLWTKILIFVLKCCPSAQSLDGSDRWHDSNRAASSVSQSLVLIAWLHVYQPYKLAWGGARDGGKREAAVS